MGALCSSGLENECIRGVQRIVSVVSKCGGAATAVYHIDPLRDSRWSKFVEDHPLGTVFHSAAWLDALQRTYGYEPAVITTSASTNAIENGLVFCRIASWLTGRRLVSLPFSDHCDVLTSSLDDDECLLAGLANGLSDQKYRYAEIRPRGVVPVGQTGFQKTQEFFLHRLDLQPSLEDIFNRFHKDSIQRKIRRAEREGLTFEEGQSAVILDKFYHLLLLTRRRHQVPPPPRDWFKNLIATFGDKLRIRIAATQGCPIASILTLQFKDTLVYKYGGSDQRFHALGGMHALFWRAIQDAKRDGMRVMDFGRSDADNQGLITFKDRWGTSAAKLTYFRYPAKQAHASGPARSGQLAKRVVSHLPASFLVMAGKLLYKHVG